MLATARRRDGRVSQAAAAGLLACAVGTNPSCAVGAVGDSTSSAERGRVLTGPPVVAGPGRFGLRMTLSGQKLIVTAPGLRPTTGADTGSEMYAYDGKNLARLIGPGTSVGPSGSIDCVGAVNGLVVFLDDKGRVNVVDPTSGTVTTRVDTDGAQCPLAATDACVVITAPASTVPSRASALCQIDGWVPRAMGEAARGLSIVVGHENAVVGLQQGNAHLLTLGRRGSIDSDVAIPLPEGIPDNAALTDDTLAVRLRRGDSSSRVVVFRKHEGAWVQGGVLESPTNPQKNSFGSAIAISGNWMIVGDPVDNAVADRSGAVFVYARHEQAWKLVRTIKDSKAKLGTFLGISAVLTDGAVAFLGAPGMGSEAGTGMVLEVRLESAGHEVSFLAP